MACVNLRFKFALCNSVMPIKAQAPQIQDLAEMNYKVYCLKMFSAETGA